MTTTQKTLILIVFLLFLSACSATPEAVQPTPKDPPATPPTYEESEVTYQNPSLPLHTIKLPEGFHISLFATNIKGARSLELTENGPASRTPSKNKGEGWTLFVGSRAEGKVYALKDRDGDFKADQVFTIASGLESPNGVAFKDGNLYVTEISRILRFDDIENRLENPPAPVVVSDDFPTETHHGWKFIGIGPDDRLYVPVGAPCNICLSEDSLFASITSMELDGSDRRIVASGIRNTVGFDWHPQTKELWFTDNGPDWLGNDQPGDELNRVTKDGQHFGYPFCHQGDLEDKTYTNRSCDEFTPPEQVLGPHVAALGMRFYTGNLFPDEYKNQIFIAEHGSWNRVPKIGYRLTLVRLKGGKAISYEPFAEGWVEGNSQWGRPVDIEEMPDGSLLVSDDYAGAVYRIWYE